MSLSSEMKYLVFQTRFPKCFSNSCESWGYVYRWRKEVAKRGGGIKMKNKQEILAKAFSAWKGQCSAETVLFIYPQWVLLADLCKPEVCI